MKEVTKRICEVCLRSMYNSNSIFKEKNKQYLVHTHCKETVGCSNCLSMIVRKVEGECICGRNVRFKGSNYFITGRKK